jgi:putative aminopeptidase FrvX
MVFSFVFFVSRFATLRLDAPTALAFDDKAACAFLAIARAIYLKSATVA